MVIDKMKDVYKDISIAEFVGTKSKVDAKWKQYRVNPIN